MHTNVGIVLLAIWIRRAQWSLSLSYVMTVQKAVTYNIYFLCKSSLSLQGQAYYLHTNTEIVFKKAGLVQLQSVTAASISATYILPCNGYM